jgi:hypothetical protein
MFKKGLAQLHAEDSGGFGAEELGGHGAGEANEGEGEEEKAAFEDMGAIPARDADINNRGHDQGHQQFKRGLQ